MAAHSLALLGLAWAASALAAWPWRCDRPEDTTI